MLVYKYMSYKRFLESVTQEGVYLKISRPCEFNDPFDCAGTSRGAPTKELVTEIREKHMPGLDLFADNSICKVLAVMLSSRRTFDSAYRVFSASDAKIVGTFEEMLMWAHYGDSFKGIRVAIDVDQVRAKCKRVRYEKVMPCLNLDVVKSLNPFSDNAVRKFLMQCLLTKNVAWRYEKERRIVFDVESPEVKRWTLRDSGAKVDEAMFMWTPDKTVIRQVCIGSEMSRTSEGVNNAVKLLQRLNEHGYNIEGRMAIRGGRYGCCECQLR